MPIYDTVYNTSPDQCPRCQGKRILGPRTVRDDEIWCNCYGCGHEWRVNKRKSKGRKFGTPVPQFPHRSKGSA